MDSPTCSLLPPTNAMECVNDAALEARNDIVMHIPELSQLPSLSELSAHQATRPSHAHSSSPISAIDADYEMMLKENIKPNNGTAFGTPIKFPFSPKNDTPSKQHRLGNKNKRSSLC